MHLVTLAVEPLIGEVVAPALATLLAVAGFVVLQCCKPRVRGTTLVAAWYWSVLSWASISTVEVIAAVQGNPPADSGLVSLRFVAIMSAFCPTMAVLGAKRPQDTAWQFIVFSLWAILSLPGAEWLLFGGPQEIHTARFWFLVALIGVGALNGLATRFWPSSLLFCLGQIALLIPYLSPGQTLFHARLEPGVGQTLMLCSWILMAAGVPRAARAAMPLDRVWLDFRDAFGAVWGLRVVERMNASAAMYDWPVMLTWRGFCDRHTGAVAESVPAAVEESLRTLLRRFVTPAWIDARLAAPTSTPVEPAAKV